MVCLAMRLRPIPFWRSFSVTKAADIPSRNRKSGAGVAAVALSVFFDALPFRLYAVYDYWHSNPDFVLARCGVLLLILTVAYLWCRYGLAQKMFSPVIQLGHTSLLVYWVHIEFVYGRFSILPKQGCSILKATTGLVTIFLAMLLLSLARTRFGRGGVRVWRRGPEPGRAAPVV